jgi:predicted ATP-binding protein involved in virulence
LFDHTVHLNLDERVTIITGPNGYGKTTLLRLVDAFATGKYAELRRIAFRDLHITFDNDQSVQILRVDSSPQGKPQAGPDLTITLLRGNKKEMQATIRALSPEVLGVPNQMITSGLPFLAQTGGSTWRDIRTGEELSLEDIARAYPNYLPIPYEKMSGFVEPPWLTEFRKTVSVRFIEVQRLLRVGKTNPHRNIEEDQLKPAVTVYSRELADLIKGKLAEYATLSQSLDRSFPKRLFEETNAQSKTPTSVEKLRSRLQQLENKRKDLTEAGLLNKESEQFDLPSTLNDSTLTSSVLPIYAEDAEQKLHVFDDIAPKIELLKSIINTHFKFKLLSIDRETGFQFLSDYPGTANKPRRLLASRLSSGEQHMLVLLFELLFKVSRNSLVMIDEPEISLHVAWQLEFLSDIQRVTELTGIDVLLATHAPGIINERRDLAVSLEEPVGAK